MSDDKQLWTDERIRGAIRRWVDPADVAIMIRDDLTAQLAAAQERIVQLEHEVARRKSCLESMQELVGVVEYITMLKAHIAQLEAERDMYKAQAGLLEDNGRMAAWRMVNAEERVREQESIAGQLERVLEMRRNRIKELEQLAQQPAMPESVRETMRQALIDRRVLLRGLKWFYTDAERQQLLAETEAALAYLDAQPKVDDTHSAGAE